MSSLTDAFGSVLCLEDEVAFAGTDAQRKPTINWGTIDAINMNTRRVRIIREERNGMQVNHADRRRRVWVDTSKVIWLRS